MAAGVSGADLIGPALPTRPPSRQSRMNTEIPFFNGRIAPEGGSFDAWKTQSLLDSLEQGGLQWPSSCRSGTCRTESALEDNMFICSWCYVLLWMFDMKSFASGSR